MPSEIKEDWKVRFGGEHFSNVYFAEIYCRNCKWEAQICIRRGVPKLAVDVSDLECIRCGCKEISKW